MIEFDLDVDTDVRLIEIQIDGDWTTDDFFGILIFIKKIFVFLKNIEHVNRTKIAQIEIADWCKAVRVEPRLNTPNDLFIQKALLGLKILENVAIADFPMQLRNNQQELEEIYRIVKLEKKIETTVFKDFVSTSFPVRKIKYNSPGEIIVEVPRVLASQGAQLLNTLLLYSRKKKELELTNQLKELEVNERRSILENQKRLEALQAVEDDLQHAVSIVGHLAKLKESLKSIGTTEEEATNFVQRWLLDRLDIIFPDADKITRIDLLEN